MPQRKSNKVPLGKQMKELRMQVEILRKQFQAFNLKILENHSQFEERNMTNWEYLWGLIEVLRVEGKLSFLTEENLEKFRKVMIDKWSEESLNNLKESLSVGEGLCARCRFRGGAPAFYEDDQPDPICPNCREKDSIVLKGVSEEADCDL